jgi:hypothetical protein
MSWHGKYCPAWRAQLKLVEARDEEVQKHGNSE